MPIYMKMGDLDGAVTDAGHMKWIEVLSVSSAIYRTVPQGAKDVQRTKGDTTLADIVVVRNCDPSSTKLQQSCANGTFHKKCELHFCTTVKNKQEPYLKYELENCLISSYSFHGNSKAEPLPSEEITFGYTKATWTSIVVDPETGDTKGNVPGKYAPGEGKS